MPMVQAISKEVWNNKYRYNNESEEEFYTRIAKALAPEKEVDKVIQLLAHHAMAIGGRGNYGVGTGRKNTTFSNCFVQPIVRDSLRGIMKSVEHSAVTMKAGGGVGYNFSVLRPKGTVIKTSGEKSSGVVSFMQIFDSTCSTIQAGGNRRGAQMGVLGIWHPDAIDFIKAKRAGGLTNFNISLYIPDGFMEAVEKGLDWTFIFPDTTCPEYEELWHSEEGGIGGNIKEWLKRGLPCVEYDTINAAELFEMIMKSNYEYAEPGVLFEDTINRYNNLWWIAYILATNPCGEQPLPAYESCNLGSVNLAAMVVNPFGNKPMLHQDMLKQAVRYMVAMLDNMLDQSYFPLEEQRARVLERRAVGLGITGLADMFAMMKMKYSDPEAVKFGGDIMRQIRDEAYRASIELAKEKGAFPAFDADKFLEGEFVKQLPEDIKFNIRKYGIRNSRLLSIAPTGTMSIMLNNVSSGIEPIFALEYERKIKNPDGVEEMQTVEDFAWFLYKQMFKTDKKPEYMQTADELHVDAHIAMQAELQKYVDTSISKTINVPVDYPYEDFKKIYWKAYLSGLKGCTTYRPNDILGSVLKVKGKEEKKPNNVIEFPNSGAIIERELMDIEEGMRHRMAWKNGTKVYVNISLDEMGQPLELFVKLPKKAGMELTQTADFESGNMVLEEQFNPNLYLERVSDWEFISRLVSKLLRVGYPVDEIMDDADKAALTMHSMPAIVKRVLKEYMPKDSAEKIEEVLEERKGGALCKKCGEYMVVNRTGCPECLNCGDSKCA